MMAEAGLPALVPFHPYILRRPLETATSESLGLRYKSIHKNKLTGEQVLRNKFTSSTVVLQEWINTITLANNDQNLARSPKETKKGVCRKNTSHKILSRYF
ncbi:hypothetical protein E2C01_055588 [Portunus trituberculatus]|uniref:Uncharacterized protein n=1 Tax=Portunus trituberculatus TaxID=210409 RepID=A0A5B7GVY1_PORTR|nr:hypothetical protein [Portunus trituberculatus]